MAIFPIPAIPRDHGDSGDPSDLSCIIALMKGKSIPRAISLFLVFFLITSQTWATCGGGGGGGMGGMGGGAGSQTYPVPWKVVQPTDPPIKDGLAVYWLP